MTSGTEDLSSATDAAEITPSDTTNLEPLPRAIYVGGTGNVSVVMASGGEVTFNNVPDASILDIQTIRIKATGTTATNIIALY